MGPEAGRLGHWCTRTHGGQTDLPSHRAPAWVGETGLPHTHAVKAKGCFSQGGQRGLPGAGGTVREALHPSTRARALWPHSGFPFPARLAAWGWTRERKEADGGGASQAAARAGFQ